MASWMHFIGKNYYRTIHKFRKEAEQYGITRRVSLIGAGAANMSWGDMVICLQREGESKSYSVFCEFPITRFVGLSEPGRKLLAEDYAMKQTSDEPEKVDKECGSYETEGSWQIQAPLSEMAKKLQGAKKDMDIGKCMVGCYPEDITWLEKPYPKIQGFTQTRGFRAYNREQYQADLMVKRMTHKRTVLQGTYYTKVEKPEEEGSGIVQPVRDYMKIEEINRIEKAKAVLQKAGLLEQLELL